MKKFFNSTPPESNQDAFNKILSWLTRPDGSLCVGKDGGCSYRSPKGNNACAIGVLIPTKLAQSIEEGGGPVAIARVLKRCPVAKKWFAKCNVEFLMDMQVFHDNNMFCDSNAYRLKLLESTATTFKLKIPKDIKAFFSK